MKTSAARLALPLAAALACACGSTSPNATGPNDESGDGAAAIESGNASLGPDGSGPDQTATGSQADGGVDSNSQVEAGGASLDAGGDAPWACTVYGSDICYCTNSGSEDGSAGCGGPWSCCFAASTTHETCECTMDDPTACAQTIASDSRLRAVPACP